MILHAPDRTVLTCDRCLNSAVAEIYPRSVPAAEIATASRRLGWLTRHRHGDIYDCKCPKCAVPQ